jgi:hypothetical protein
MRTQAIIALWATLLVFTAKVLAQDPYWEFMLHPESLADTIPATMAQFSCFDLNGGNDDYARFLGSDPDGFRIMCDVQGPGVLTHFWCTQRSLSDTARWKIYVDNMVTPLFDVTIHDLFGRIAPFLPPLCDTVNYARYSYVPIPFATRLKITSHYLGGLYYQFEALRYAPGTAITSMTNPPSADYLVRLDSLQQRFANPAAPLDLGGEVTRVEGAQALDAGQTQTIVEQTGSGVSRRLVLWLATHDRNLHDSLWVRVYADDYPLPLMDGPVNSLLGAADGWRPFQSALSGMSGDSLYLNIPMPFRAGLRVEAENRTAAPQLVGAALETVPREPADVKPFRLSSYTEHAQPNPPFNPYTVLNTPGPGNFLGIFWQMRGTDHRTLEGDERMAWNGAAVPQWQGTGTEDYFNGGYFWSNPNGQVDPHPLASHGPLYLGGGNAAAYRWHIVDPVPFADGFRMTLECGGYSEVTADYQTTAFYYAPIPRWTVVDLSGDGRSYPGEPLRMIGYGLTPQTAVSGATWNGQELPFISGDTEVRASGTLDYTVASPTEVTGVADIVVALATGGETARRDWEVRATPEFSFRPVRLDPDTLVFVGDTLDVTVHGIPAGQSATVSYETQAFPWVDPSVVADAASRLEGQVVIPAGLPAGELTIHAMTDGGIDGTADRPLKHYRVIRYEAEDLSVTHYSGITWSDRWAPNWTLAGQDYPWGRDVIRWHRGAQAGDSISLQFSFPDSGNFRAGYFFGRTTSTAIVQISIDDSPDASYDPFSAANGWRIARSDTVWGGWRLLTRGLHTLTVKMTGRNPGSVAWESWLDQIIIGSEFPDAARDRAGELPERFELAQNFPNPFNPSTQIQFSVPRASDLRIAVYDLLGREVALLADGRYAAGEHTINWDGGALASGIYFIRMEAPRTQIVKKAVLLR